MIVLIVSLLLFVVVMGMLDARLRWPRPTDKVQRYVSVAERGMGQRKD